jgi:ferredoxin
MKAIDLKFGKQLKKYGAVDFNACYNCGTCTAVCDLADETDSFPREMVRSSVLGLRGDIDGSLKPWLCYYCGECTTFCPQEAKPGELMMSLRRYLTSRYDWTGLSGILYRNLTAYVIAFLVIVAGVLGLFFSRPWDQREWMHIGHNFEMFAIAGVFALVLLPNIVRMWFYAVWRRSRKFRIKSYLLLLPELFVHMFTQKRTLSCAGDRDNKLWWFEHLVLVIGYLSLLFTTVFLNWFSTSSAPVVILGYTVSAVVFVVTFDFVLRRIRKKSEKSVFAHPSDWFFLIWLFLMGVSAFAVRLLIDLQALADNFWLYLLHLIVLAQWALVIVPFGKWTHFLYRALAMYFDKVLKAEVKPVQK